MKKGWQTQKLGDVCDFEGGSQPPKSQFVFKEKPGYVRFLQIRDFGSDKNITYIPKSKKNRLCEENDILIGRYGASVGKILTSKSGAYNVALMKTIPNLEVLNPSWFYNYLISNEFQNHLLKVADRSAQAGFSKDDIYNFPVPVPPLSEQRRIVGIFDEAFDGIATAKANAEENVRNARALFASHLQSVFTQRGKGWAAKPLEGIATIRTGKRDANHQVENGPYPFYTCAFGQFRSPTFSFEGASIILPGNGANVGKVFFHNGKFEAYQRTYVINELSQAINPRFLFYCFSANWPEWISTKQFGSATNYIVVGDLKAFPVPTPPLPVQDKTVQQLECFTEETQRLASLYERKLAALEALKKSLLHQAFTGQL